MGADKKTRREVLAAIGAVAMAPAMCAASQQNEAPWRAAVKKYLASCAAPDGGYRWHPRDRAHLTPTFGAIGCFQILGEDPPDKAKLAAFVRSAHPANLKKLEQEYRIFDYEQIQSLVWLGQDVSEFRAKVAGWTKPVEYLKRYEQHGYPVFQSEAAALLCRPLVGITEPPPETIVEYFKSRQRENGSFNNTPAADGSDGNVLNTWWGLRAWKILKQKPPGSKRLGEWLWKCGFSHQPDPEIGGVDDVAYVWAAINTMASLETEALDFATGYIFSVGSVDYIRSLWNADGGFGDRPGWDSNPLATYRALDSLSRSSAIYMLKDPPSHRQARPALSKDLQVFSIQLEAHGQGSPAEAVELARSLRIHLWGAKNAAPDWIERAQKIADEAKVPVTFFPSNEEYGTWLTFPGHGTYSHMIDVAAPAGSDFGKPLANDAPEAWKDFRTLRLSFLWKANGQLIWQFGENEPLVRMILDESIERGGYAAISTFHFGNPDFTNSEPFLQRYRGQIPFVALQDAHGPEPWWFSDMTTGFRTLFLARESTWAGWQEALRLNRVVAVRHDAVSKNETWMHGTDDTIDFVTKRQLDWRWWDNPDITRPMISIVAIEPDDRFDAEAPKDGLRLRIRTAHTNDSQGRRLKPLAELIKVLIDGVDTQVQGNEFVSMQNFNPGKHTVTAEANVLATGGMVSRTIEFEVK